MHIDIECKNISMSANIGGGGGGGGGVTLLPSSTNLGYPNHFILACMEKCKKLRQSVQFRQI